MTKRPSAPRARTRSAANNNVAPARARKRSASRPSGAGEAAPYHHGALHGALLEAAERVLERDGLAGPDATRGRARGRRLARSANPSFRRPRPASSANSPRSGFGNSTPRWPMAGAAGDARRAKRRRRRAKAYVAYARAHPGMYGLMFRTERLDMKRPSLHAGRQCLVRGAGRRGRRQPARTDFRTGAVARTGRRDRAGLVAGPRLHHAAARRPAFRHPSRDCPKGTDAETLLDAMLSSTRPAAGAVVSAILAAGRAVVSENRHIGPIGAIWGRFTADARNT